MGRGSIPNTEVSASGLVSRAVTKTTYKLPMIIALLLTTIGLFYLGHIRADGTYLREVLPFFQESQLPVLESDWHT
jgi:hypothetical protein